LVSSEPFPPCDSSLLIFTARVAINPFHPLEPFARYRKNLGRGGGIRTPIPGFGDRSPNRWTTPLHREPAADFGNQLKLLSKTFPPDSLTWPFTKLRSSAYFTSLCGVCFRQARQNFLVSRRSECFFLFFVVV
jgi:hypothetical protein